MHVNHDAFLVSVNLGGEKSYDMLMMVERTKIDEFKKMAPNAKPVQDDENEMAEVFDNGCEFLILPAEDVLS